MSASTLPTQSPVTAPTLECPDDNNAIYTAANGGRFTVICDENFPFNDLQMFNDTSTLNDCIEHCAYFNRLNPSIPCVGVVLAPFASDCWIKGYIGPGSSSNISWSATECTSC